MMFPGLLLILLVFGLIGLVVIGVVAYAAGWRPDFLEQNSPQKKEQTSLEILKERYARGEIDQEEYQQRRRDLEG